MAKYRGKSCRNCGALLDPDERCNCQKSNQEKGTEQGGEGNKNTGRLAQNIVFSVEQYCQKNGRSVTAIGR